jgi:uncharacterized SAM-dependent methyltransferase
MPAGQPDRSLGPELRAPTRYTDGSTDEMSEALDVIADLLAAPESLPEYHYDDEGHRIHDA